MSTFFLPQTLRAVGGRRVMPPFHGGFNMKKLTQLTACLPALLFLLAACMAKGGEKEKTELQKAAYGEATVADATDTRERQHFYDAGHGQYRCSAAR